MTESPSEVNSTTRTADQQAIDDYFASARFQERKLSTHSSRRIASGAASLLCGISGLAAITIFFAVALPVSLEIIEEVMPRPSFVPLMLIVQTLLFPPLIAFSFATITPMFWYGSVVLRFLMGSVAVIPGYFGFMIALLLMDNVGPSDMWSDVAVVLFAYFVATALISVIVQIWSPWTMIHARESDQPLPPTGIRTIIELTGITAVGFAIFMAIEVRDVIEGIFLFAGFGMLAAVGVISALIIYFRAIKQYALAAIVVGVFVFGSAFFVNAFFAAMEFGWEVLGTEVLYISMASIWGAAVIFGAVWLCLRWLRFCGWKCVNQRLESQLDGVVQ